MPFTQATALGRKVKLDDWLGFHRDRLLATFYTLRDAGHDDGLTMKQIESINGLSYGHVETLVRRMHEQGLVAYLTNNNLIATERGIRWVEESPVQP